MDRGLERWEGGWKEGGVSGVSGVLADRSRQNLITNDGRRLFTGCAGKFVWSSLATAWQTRYHEWRRQEVATPADDPSMISPLPLYVWPESGLCLMTSRVFGAPSLNCYEFTNQRAVTEQESCKKCTSINRGYIYTRIYIYTYIYIHCIRKGEPFNISQ